MAKPKGRATTRGTAKAARVLAPEAKPARPKTGATASKSPVAAAPTQSHPVVRAAVAELGPDVVASLAKLGRQRRTAWEHADTPALVGLERWGTALATKDRTAGVAALVMVGQRALALIAKSARAELDGMGVFGKDSDPIVDGAATEVQLRRAARWVSAPTAANAKLVEAAYDRTRQLQVWEEDMYPAPDAAYWWATELGQCACAGVRGKPWAQGADSYDGWPAVVSIGRGLVIAARSIRPKQGEDPALLASLLG